MRGEGGIAGEGKLVGVPKFYSWGKHTMQSDWMSNASSALCINLYFILRGSFLLHLGGYNHDNDVMIRAIVRDVYICPCVMYFTYFSKGSCFSI